MLSLLKLYPSSSTKFPTVMIRPLPSKRKFTTASSFKNFRGGLLMATYVWYSKSTSVTGKALVQALGCEGGIYAPKRRHGVVVCYGAIPKTVTHRGT